MSCLFLSLSHFIHEVEENQLRQMICDYMATNPMIMEGLTLDQVIHFEEGVEKTRYIEGMRNPSTWGGAIEIKSFCEMFKIEVEVEILSSHQKAVLFSPTLPSNTTLLKPWDRIRIQWQGHHFEPLVVVTASTKAGNEISSEVSTVREIGQSERK